MRQFYQDLLTNCSGGIINSHILKLSSSAPFPRIVQHGLTALYSRTVEESK